MAKQKQQLAKVRSSAAVFSLVRRKELGRAYEEGKLDRKSVWEMHFGNDPRKILPSQHQKLPKVQPLDIEDPDTPASCFPDRIVECRWIQDARARVLGVDDQIPILDKPPGFNDNRPNFFLQRRMLTEPYGEGVVLHICPTCGQKLLSRPGAVYHLESKKCGRSSKGTARSDSQINKLDDRANCHLSQKDKQRGRAVLPTSIAAMPVSKPQETQEMRILDALAQAKKASSKPEVKKRKDKVMEPVALAKTMKEKKMEITADPNFVDPRKVLADLESQHRQQMSILMGPMYPAVYKALKFEKPGTKRKRKRGVSKIEVDVEQKRQEIKEARHLLEQEKKRLALLKLEDVLTEEVNHSSQNRIVAKVAATAFVPSNEAAEIHGPPQNQNASADATNLQVESVPITNQNPEPGLGMVALNVATTSAVPIASTGNDASSLTNVTPVAAIENDKSAQTDSAPVATTKNDTSERGSTYQNTNPEKTVPEMPESSDPQDQILTRENDTEVEDATGVDLKATDVKKKAVEPEHKYFLDSMRIRPPMIDTRVLVHEIDAGRYPSINRTVAKLPPKSPAGGKCPICKTAKPPLHKCNFCFRKVHIACARLKWNLPDPEPYDDFLCTVCIQAITHRRNRAERRRIERAHGVEAAATSLSVTEIVHPPIPLHRKVEKSREYEAVVSQGRHMANLIDLENDTRTRLQREMENCTLSSLRRQMMK
eukprot:scaffold793_cov161-Amphora_coffeaeformis.AAC.7